MSEYESQSAGVWENRSTFVKGFRNHTPLHFVATQFEKPVGRISINC